MAVFSQKSQEMKWQRRISARENHTALPWRHVHDKLGPLCSSPPFSSCDVCTITRPKPTSGCRSRSRSRSVVRLNARFRRSEHVPVVPKFESRCRRRLVLASAGIRPQETSDSPSRMLTTAIFAFRQSCLYDLRSSPSFGPTLGRKGMRVRYAQCGCPSPLASPLPLSPSLGP